MFQRVYSALIAGLYALPVEIECFIGNGMPYFNIVGIGSSFQDTKERIRSALKSAGFSLPSSRITVNIRCLDPRFTVSSLGIASLDLPIALSILACQKLIPSIWFTASAWFGELSLNGDLKPICGSLTMAKGIKEKMPMVEALYFPKENAPEAALIQSLPVYGIRDLKTAVNILRHQEKVVKEIPIHPDLISQNSSLYDEIRGQSAAKRCAVLSACGMHHLLLIGPPGCGKTMLSSTLPSLLPPLTYQEQLELTEIYSCNHLLPSGTSIITQRPFRNPHHTATIQSLLGGGAIPKAGEVTLAHHGILFLDEFTEIPRPVIESLREPLEEGIVRISRVQGTFEYPSRFLLSLAMNPCPCGYYPDTKRCHCSPSRIRSYYEKIHSPLTDRMDIMLRMEPVRPTDTTTSSLPFSEAKALVAKVHQIQRERFQQEGVFNASMTAAQIKQYCPLDTAAQNFMEDALLKLGLSMRSYHKVLKVARTIADTEDCPSIQLDHLLEALQYRTTLVAT